MSHDPQELEEHDRGLSHDLLTLLSRRRALALLGGAGLAAALAGCGASGGDGNAPPGSGNGPPGAAPPPGPAAGGSPSGSGIPEETAGPFPGDGSTGVPLTIRLKVLDTGNGSGALKGAAVYVWHCDSVGRYSLYSQGVTQENYLRGVQETAGDGSVTFTSVYPGAYSGRWPHVHFEVYPSLQAATSAGGKLRTSQLALPEAACRQVYATDGYGQSLQNLARTSLDGDLVFSDGYSLQLAKVTGNVGDGLTATLNVPV